MVLELFKLFPMRVVGPLVLKLMTLSLDSLIFLLGV